MKLTECFINIRDITHDTQGSTWSNQFVARAIDFAVRLMFRAQVEADPSYHNFEFNLDDLDGRQLHSDLYEWTLPPWVYRITKVRRQATTTEIPGPNVFPKDFLSNRPGFNLINPRTIIVKGLKETKDYTLNVAKIPSRLHAGACPADAPSATTMLTVNHSAIAATAYPFEIDTNWYANGVFEMTGVAGTGRDPVGQLRVCTASSRVQDGSTANYRTQLTFAQNWTENPDSADTYEMHPEVKDSDLNYLFLLAAQQCFRQQRVLDGLESIGGAIAEERRKFMSSIRPVQDMEPAFWLDGSELEEGLDVDRDILLGRFPTGWF